MPHNLCANSVFGRPEDVNDISFIRSCATRWLWINMSV